MSSSHFYLHFSFFRSDFKINFFNPLETSSFPSSCFASVSLHWELLFALSPPQAGLPVETRAIWRFSSDGETSLQTLLETLPVISHHWHQHALEGYFFRACKQRNGDFIKVLLLPYQLLRVNASKTEQLLSWDSMKWLFEALMHLFVFGIDNSSGSEIALFNSFTQSVSKCMPGTDLGSNLLQLHHLNGWFGRLECTCHSD